MSLWFNWGIHVALEGIGAGTLWCILRGCSNKSHKHGVKHRKGLAIFVNISGSMIVAFILVKVVG